MGIYPDVPLKEARCKRNEYKKQIKNEDDPTLLKRENKRQIKENIDNTLKNIALEWHEQKWRAQADSKDAKLELSRLNRYIFPDLGHIPIKKIVGEDVIITIRKIEEKGVLAEARKVRSVLGQVFEYAIMTKRAEHNPVRETARLYKRSEIKHYPAFSEDEFKEFIKSFNSFKGNVLTKLALKLLMLTFVRSGELRGARWEEFNFDKKEWRIPAERMKMKEEHVVPLSKLAPRTLEEAYKY